MRQNWKNLKGSCNSIFEPLTQACQSNTTPTRLSATTRLSSFIMSSLYRENGIGSGSSSANLGIPSLGLSTPNCSISSRTTYRFSPWSPSGSPIERGTSELACPTSTRGTGVTSWESVCDIGVTAGVFGYLRGFAGALMRHRGCSSIGSPARSSSGVSTCMNTLISGSGSNCVSVVGGTLFRPSAPLFRNKGIKNKLPKPANKGRQACSFVMRRVRRKLNYKR